MLDDRFVFEDTESGREYLKRSGWNAVMVAVKTRPRPFDVLLVTEQSRLGRDTISTPADIRTITTLGVRIFAMNEDREIKGDGIDAVMNALRGYGDEKVSTDTSVRVASKFRDKIQGRLTVGGQVYGFRTEKIAKGKSPRIIHKPPRSEMPRQSQGTTPRRLDGPAFS